MIKYLADRLLVQFHLCHQLLLSQSPALELFLLNCEIHNDLKKKDELPWLKMERFAFAVF